MVLVHPCPFLQARLDEVDNLTMPINSFVITCTTIQFRVDCVETVFNRLSFAYVSVSYSKNLKFQNRNRPGVDSIGIKFGELWRSRIVEINDQVLDQVD